MKKTLLVSLSLMLSLSLVASLAMAKTVTSTDNQVLPNQDTGFSYSLDQSPDAINNLRSSAAQGTTFLAWYRFSSGASCVSEGWTQVDLTAQLADFFHVDDYAGLAGMGALEGAQSMWCGARPSAANPYCGYAALPGYGNNWDQAFCMRNCLTVADTTTATVTFLTLWDSEPSYDQTFVEMEDCALPGAWSALVLGGATANPGLLDGAGSGVVTATIPPGHSGSVRVRFHFVADGAWSDEDGLWDTVGAISIDSLSVSGPGTAGLAVEDFEGELVGAVNATDWDSCTPAGFGDFASTFPGLVVVQEDPCFSNFTCMWGFFNGSTDNYGCGGFPLQTAMPYGNSLGQYMNNGIESPSIPWIGAGSVADLSFLSYRDLPLDNLQFYTWGVASVVAGCKSGFKDRNFVYFGGQKDWLRVIETFGDLVEPGTTDIVVQLAAVDMCGVWCPGAGNVGSGACHSHAPLIDDVRVWRINTAGPQWSVRDIDLFNDGFSEDGTLTGTARADMTIDRLISSNPGILPGDSSAVTVSDPAAGGFAADPVTGFPAIYAWVNVSPLQPAKAGNALTQDAFRYPVVGSAIHGGLTYYQVRMDTSFTNGIARTGAQPDRFCVDLNDNLFGPGDTINFVYSATGATNNATYWTENTVGGGTADQAFAFANPSEFQILPGAGPANGGDILYVDAFSGRGAQPFFDTAFQMIGIANQVDRYDIRGPSSSVSNRPGDRVKNVLVQLVGVYRKIIWNTGDLSTGLIGDGSGTPEKADDALLLTTFLDNLTAPNGGGVYFSGDDIADELYNKGLSSSASLIALRTWIQGTATSSAAALGLGTTPLVVGSAGSCFEHTGVADTLIAYGGCGLINDFDVLTPTGSATLEATYRGNSLTGGAIIAQITPNTQSANVGVVLSGFSYHYIRDDAIGGVFGTVPDRVHHLRDILVWLNNNPPIPSGAGPVGLKNSLSQNYPNPFNPQTSIEFSLKTRSHVTLNVYNVAGQLVRTLVNDVRDAGVQPELVWDGRNSAGQSVSSGVYFYKLVTKDFTQTRKMVLLK